MQRKHRYIKNKGHYICCGWFNSNFKININTDDYLRKYAIYYVKSTFDKKINGYTNIKFFTLNRQQIKLKIKSKAFKKFFIPIQWTDIQKWILFDRYKYIERDKRKAIEKIIQKKN